MIFAKVDVNMPSHHRLLRIPRKHRAAALGVWLAALCYSRGQELDGFCPFEEIEPIAKREIIDQLLAVGLFEKGEHNGAEGVIVVRYADHNETKAQIELRRSSDRNRKKKTTCEPIPSGIQTDSERTPDGIQLDSTRIPTAASAGFPDSDSGSGSVSPPGRVQRGDLRQPQPGERYVARDDELTPEFTAIAEQNSVQRVEQCWKSFCGKRAGKLLNVAGDFQSWCVRWASYERKERDEAREKAQREGVPRYRDWPVKKASA